jgi:hypothetical protein
VLHFQFIIGFHHVIFNTGQASNQLLYKKRNMDSEAETVVLENIINLQVKKD